MTPDQTDQLIASIAKGQQAAPEMPKTGEVPFVEHVPDPNAKSPWRQLTPEEVAAVAASATGPGTRIPPAVEAAPVVTEKSTTTIKTDTNPSWFTNDTHITASSLAAAFCGAMVIWGNPAYHDKWVATAAACVGWLGASAKAK